jgi:superfamily II RNA helicase
MSAPLSRKNLPENPTPDDILNAFLDYLTATNTEPYDHKEEAILELFAGNNVILNTPTGSGKSLVALALQFKSLCHVLGPENVGMITGDATVNHDASVICCTAEILANIALRDAAHALVDDVIMDEFHYYYDHSRGTAWQVPLLTLPHARFLLFSEN